MTLSSDVQELRKDGKIVDATFGRAGRHAILWHDAKGHTVTLREPQGIHVGGAVTQEAAWKEFRAFVNRVSPRSLTRKEYMP